MQNTPTAHSATLLHILLVVLCTVLACTALALALQVRTLRAQAFPMLPLPGTNVTNEGWSFSMPSFGDSPSSEGAWNNPGQSVDPNTDSAPIVLPEMIFPTIQPASNGIDTPFPAQPETDAPAVDVPAPTVFELPAENRCTSICQNVDSAMERLRALQEACAQISE